MKARIRIDPQKTIGAIDPRLYSSFIEQMGRAVYTGIYEPGHPSADEYGFRTDVAALIRPLNLSCIRYPGGNFLSGYDWKDGIGPRESRPARPDMAWSAVEPNEVGTDEFLRWCARIGAEPMMGVNLGTGTPREAAELLEYCNSDMPTYWADRRRKNGHAEPYRVRLWCLGNEMDGPWQICAKTAEEYGRIACETGKLMKMLDPSIELVACGSSYRAMPTFGAWEREVLRRCYPYVDYLSLHQYYQNPDGDVMSFLARSEEMAAFIDEVAGICGEVRAELGQEKPIRLSFDEWNIWYHYHKDGREPPKWTVARPIEEERFDFADALLAGGMLITLMNHADVVKIACLAQLVNVIAPIMTEPGGRAWVQTIYWPFLYASRFGRGTALALETDGPTYRCAVGDAVPYLTSAAVLSEDGGEISVFLVNRHPDEPMRLELDAGFGGMTEWLSMYGTPPDAVSGPDGPDAAPREMPLVGLGDVALPPPRGI